MGGVGALIAHNAPTFFVTLGGGFYSHSSLCLQEESVERRAPLAMPVLQFNGISNEVLFTLPTQYISAQNSPALVTPGDPYFKVL